MLGAEIARRKRGAPGLLAVVDVVALFGQIFFVPVSLVTLLSGIAAAWSGPGFAQFWVVLGLAGFAATFLTGILLIKPRSEAIAALAATAGATPEALAQRSRDLLTIARFDYVVLFLVVLVMTLKPTANDVALLASFAAVAGVGAMPTLVKGMRADGHPAQ